MTRSRCKGADGMWGEIQANAFVNVAKALDDAGIKWMVMRNYEGLPDFNRSKDVDIGISKSDFQRVNILISETLNRHGFTNMFKVRYQYAICSTYFYQSEEKVDSIKIDLIDGFVWKGAQLVDFDRVYARSNKYGCFHVPSSVDDAFMLLIKPLMTGGFIKQKYVQDIDEALDADEDELLKQYKDVFGNVIYKKTAQHIIKRDYEKLIPYKKVISHSAWLRCLRRQPIKTMTQMAEHYWLEMKRWFIRKKPTIIAVLGSESIEKSAFIDAFVDKLSDLCVSERTDIILQYFQSNVSSANNKNGLEKLGGENDEETITRDVNLKRSSRLSLYAELFYYWLECLAAYWLKLKYRCRHNRKLLYKKCCIDYLLSQGKEQLFIPMKTIELFVRCIPKPDISYVFFNESPENCNHASLPNGCSCVVYKNLVDTFPNYYELDGSNDLGQLVDNALRIFVGCNEKIGKD